MPAKISWHDGEAAFLSTELCRKVWDTLLPERWALRSCGQLLVLRRYDDIYRHASAEQTPPSNLMVWDCWEERWACGSCMYVGGPVVGLPKCWGGERRAP